MEKIIALASDHAGFPLKEEIKAYFEKEGIKFIDLGTDSLASVNYPDYATKLCDCITNKEATLGVLVCGTGIGMSMAANKHSGIRAACCSDTFSARMTRMHNDANVLCMGARVVGAGLAIDMVDLFINTEFEGGRHQLRVDMLNALDK
ncbi:MAG: ribose 5-phosphate isomerase B [Clostridia bacterium]|jgi:ribose 5-phosphate isomerase B|nr:ribose 5-phosphate isomerase B [Clostridia bacterium]